MRMFSVLALVLGLALIGVLAFHIGIEPVGGAIERIGWPGFALVIVVGFALTMLPGAAFWSLLSQVPFSLFVAARQVRDSVGDVLPLTQFGGIMAGVRVLALGGVPAAQGSAAAIVDVTAEFVSQIAFIALGVVLGMHRLSADPVFAPYVRPLVLGTLLLVPGAICFVVLQKGGGILVHKMAAFFLPETLSRTRSFWLAVDALYANPWRLLLGTNLHLAGWVASGVWLYTILRLAGASIDLPRAIAIQSLLEALRSAAVFIPSSVGVQEVGYATLAPLFGVGPEFGLAVALVRRARDVAVGIPVLLAWHVVEARRAMAAGPGAARTKREGA